MKKKKDLVKVDYSEIEARVLAGGVMPKGLKKNWAFYMMYGNKRTHQTLFNFKGVTTGRIEGSTK